MFADCLIELIQQKGTPCIIGLDPALKYMPSAFLEELEVSTHSPIEKQAEALYLYNLQVLDAVYDLVPAVKLQSAYYEVFGSQGIRTLERTILAARARGLLVLLDAKRGDIGTTSEAYAQAYLAGEPQRDYEIDAMTIVPYLGDDSLSPFCETALAWGKGVFVCVKTSNPGAAIVQDQLVGEHRHLYEIIADLILPWSNKSIGKKGYSSIGAVVGVTFPEAAELLRKQLPNSLFLVPGLGAQKGDYTTVRACFNQDGLGAIISSSRSIMYPHFYQPSNQVGQKAIRNAAIEFIQNVQSVLN
jgi:orotidine-5'-phosphate decarboxylase